MRPEPSAGCSEASGLSEAPEPTRGALQLDVRQLGTTTIISAEGEWDLSGQWAHQMCDRAVDRSPERLVLDLSRLEFIDMSGIRVVVALHRRAVVHDVQLIIVAGPRAVLRPFEVLGLDDVLPFVALARKTQSGAMDGDAA